MAESLLVTSEMMETGTVPRIFAGGACNVQAHEGPIRNPGRDPLHTWLDEQGWSYYDPQIHPSTHGRDYVWGIDGPQEKKARVEAELRIYEITSTTIASVTMLEILDDARRTLPSIVWFNRGKTFAPIGLGQRDELKSNEALRRRVGETVHSHLVAYVNAGNQLRNELPLMLADCAHVVFVYSFDELKEAVTILLDQARS